MSYPTELRAIAQNDYMIDQRFLETGVTLNEIADHLERLEKLHAEAMATIRRLKMERDK